MGESRVRGKNVAVRVWSLALLVLVPMVGPAQARETSRSGGVTTASFDGGTVDLARDWGDAHACLVWRQGGVVECFRTEQELDALEAELSGRHDAVTAVETVAPTGPVPTAAVAAYSCSSSLRLYDYSYFGGRRLSFWDRGFWQNVSDYGFNDRTSSYIVGGCYVYLAEHNDGAGWWYPGPTYPYAGEPVMAPGWDDVISSIYIG